MADRQCPCAHRRGPRAACALWPVRVRRIPGACPGRRSRCRARYAAATGRRHRPPAAQPADGDIQRAHLGVLPHDQLGPQQLAPRVAQQTQEAGALEFGQVEAAATGRKQRPAAVAQRPPAFQPVAGGYQAIDGDALDGMDRRGQGRAGGGQNGLGLGGNDHGWLSTGLGTAQSAVSGAGNKNATCSRLTGLQAGFPLATPGSD